MNNTELEQKIHELEEKVNKLRQNNNASHITLIRMAIVLLIYALLNGIMFNDWTRITILNHNVKLAGEYIINAFTYAVQVVNTYLPHLGHILLNIGKSIQAFAIAHPTFTIILIIGLGIMTIISLVAAKTKDKRLKNILQKFTVKALFTGEFFKAILKLFKRIPKTLFQGASSISSLLRSTSTLLYVYIKSLLRNKSAKGGETV